MNCSLHLVNIHKTLKITLDFITLSPKSQNAIKSLLCIYLENPKVLLELTALKLWQQLRL